MNNTQNTANNLRIVRVPLLERVGLEELALSWKVTTEEAVSRLIREAVTKEITRKQFERDEMEKTEVTVSLTREEMAALYKLSKANLRPLSEQVRYLVRKMLIAEGWIKPRPGEEYTTNFDEYILTLLEDALVLFEDDCQAFGSEEWVWYKVAKEEIDEKTRCDLKEERDEDQNNG
jgi:hypothetical protein